MARFSVKSIEDPELKGHQSGALPALFHTVLHEPEIPQNTGNIGRTCIGFRSELHLIEPLSFKITDRNLKRAGLDYWQDLTWHRHQNWQTFSKLPTNPKRVFLFSAFAKKEFYDFEYQRGDYFVFGKETKGLPNEILEASADRCALIPILGPVRGYNIATAVSMVLSEAFRQIRKTNSY